jgi:hypothetical protein
METIVSIAVVIAVVVGGIIALVKTISLFTDE